MQIKSLNDLQNLYKDKKLSNFIVICGNKKNEIKESEEYLKSLITILPELNSIEFSSNNFSIEDIKNACETIPVMSDIRLVHLKSPIFLSDQADTNSKNLLKEVLDYSKDVPEYTILLVTYHDIVDKSNSILRIASTLGVLGKFEIPRYGRELTTWIEDYITSNNKTINKSEAMYLTTELSNSIDNLESELQKLISYVGDKKIIDRNDIEAIIHKTSESNIFKMCDYMFKKDAKSALEVLETLLMQGEQYSKILFMIIRQFRILYSVKLLTEEGKNASEIMSTLKLQDFVYKGVSKACMSWNASVIKEILKDILETDYNIKNGRINQELGLEMLILRICK